MIRPGLHPINGPTELLIGFIVIGGGIAGLSCAIALSRVGHRVIVLEQHQENELEKMSQGGIRLAPNATKILFRWGLRDSLNAVSVSSEAVEMAKYDDGEFLGYHVWDDEIIEQTEGEYLSLHHADLRQLLLATARASGAEVHHGANIVAVDCERGHVTLSTGVTYHADIIVGADGPSSTIQKMVTNEDPYGSTQSNCFFYNTIVSAKSMLNDPDLAALYNRDHTSTFIWVGPDTSAIGFRVGGKDEFALHFWLKPTQQQLTRYDNDTWGHVDPSELHALLGRCEPRLLKMARAASVLARAQVKIVPPLHDWMHEKGRAIVLGDAAHLLPAGSIQTSALAIEDAVVLGQLFSHLSCEDQIRHFLFACQELREDRSAIVLSTEQRNLAFQMMPEGPQQVERDQMLRERLVSGRGLFGWGRLREETEEVVSEGEDVVVEEDGGDKGSEGDEEGESVDGSEEDEDDEGPALLAAQWKQMHALYAYEAKEVADEWWVKSGMLRERAVVRLKDMDEMMVQRERLRLRKGVAFEDD